MLRAFHAVVQIVYIILIILNRTRISIYMLTVYSRLCFRIRQREDSNDTIMQDTEIRQTQRTDRKNIFYCFLSKKVTVLRASISKHLKSIYITDTCALSAYDSALMHIHYR